MAARVKRGVSLYSFQEEMFLGQMTIEDCVAFAASIGAKGIEILPEQNMPSFPNIDDRQVAWWKELMAKHGLSVRDISGQASTARTTIARASTGKAGKVAAKYRDAVTGNAWSGRGLKPIWLRTALANGHKLEEFAVA